MTSSAREAILRAATRAPAAPMAAAHMTAEAIAAQARALVAPDTRDKVRPKLPRADVVESFAERLTGPKVVGASLDRVASLAELPAAVARHLAAKGRPMTVTLQPTDPLTSVDWRGSGLALGQDVDGAVIVGLASWGIAETASLVFHSAPDMPILYNFLGDMHIVAVNADSIVAHLEDYAALARAAGDAAPRNACLVTGASGTTDIEGSLVRGAHGPRELHVVIVGGGPASRV